MRNLAKKITCGVVLSLLYGSLSACGVTSEVGTTPPGAPTASRPVAAEATREEADGGGTKPVRPARTGPTTREPARPLAAAVVAPAGAAPGPVGGAPLAPPAAAEANAPNLRTQSGRIIDEAGQPLVGATVLLKGTARGASTDANGDYSLTVPLGINTFVFAYTGYTDEVAQSPDGQPLTVTLLPAAGRAPAPGPEKERKPHLRKKRP